MTLHMDPARTVKQQAPPLHRELGLTQFVYKSFVNLGGAQLVWKLDTSRLRILCYHGVFEDRLRDEPWMPGYFVSETAFERQLRYLRNNANVLPLAEAIARLRDHSLPPRCVCITFDDGYANNLQLAYPLLRKYQLPAAIFLSTAYIETGDFYPFLKLRLIRLETQAGKIDPGPDPLPDYKFSPLNAVTARANRLWDSVEARLTADQRGALRPMTIEEVRSIDPRLIEFGAHTHTHCILRNECLARRQEEIRASVQKVGEWTGRPVRIFSYPNGERGDFGEPDRQALRAAGVQAAVTGIWGANSSTVDPLELKRYPVTSRDHFRFCAEVTGFRAALRSISGGLI